MTSLQWNTTSFGLDYRLGPRETKIETCTWTLPDIMAIGIVRVLAGLNYCRLVRSVADFLQVPEKETKVLVINISETSFEVVNF